MVRVCFFLLVISHVGVCQQQNSISRRKTSLGISFSPEFCYRSLRYGDDVHWISDERNSRELPATGFTTGLNVRYLFRDDLSVDAGILYSDKSYRNRAEALTWIVQDPSLPATSEVTIHYQTIEIPLKAYYYFPRKQGRLKAFVTAGLAANVFLARRTALRIKYPDGHDVRQASAAELGYTAATFGMSVGAGVLYKCSAR